MIHSLFFIIRQDLIGGYKVSYKGSPYYGNYNHYCESIGNHLYLINVIHEQMGLIK